MRDAGDATSTMENTALFKNNAKESSSESQFTELKKIFLLGIGAGVMLDEAEKYKELLAKSVNQTTVDAAFQSRLAIPKSIIEEIINMPETKRPNSPTTPPSDSSYNEEITLQGIADMKKFMLESGISKETVEFHERIWLYSVLPYKTDEGLLAALGWKDETSK